MPILKQALVTGAGGFVGSHLVRALLGRGYSVRGLDDLSVCGNWHRLDDLIEAVDLVEGDVLDPTTLERCGCDADVVFHNAALVGEEPSRQHPGEYHAVNATATLQLLDAARHAGVQRVIFSSSCAVYGDGHPELVNETAKPDPRSPYAISKLAAEHYLSFFASAHDMETITLRYAKVFGAGQDVVSPSVTPIAFVLNAAFNDSGDSTVFAEPQQLDDFCHVENIVHANLLAAEARHVTREVINIGSGVPSTLQQAVEVTNDLVGNRIQCMTRNNTNFGSRGCVPAIGKARELLGYEPIVHLREGIERTIASHMRQRS